MSNIQSDALFILLVEKDAAFMRLAEDRFYNHYPCIIITAKGQPDVASRHACPRDVHKTRGHTGKSVPEAFPSRMSSCVCLFVEDRICDQSDCDTDRNRVIVKV